jgi:hypothetical protein
LDPSGHIAFIENWRRGLEEGREFLFNAADKLGQYGGSNPVTQWAAQKLGQAAGVLGATDSALHAANVLGNTGVLLTRSPDSEAAHQVAEEFNETIAKVEQAWTRAKGAAKTAVEHPFGTALKLADSHLEKSLARLRGEPGAVARDEAAYTEASIAVVAGSGVKAATAEIGQTLGESLPGFLRAAEETPSLAQVPAVQNAPKLIGPAGDPGGFTLRKVAPEGHHTIPKYVGGVEDQVKAPLASWEHRSFHEFLDNWKSDTEVRTPFLGPDNPGGSGPGPVRLWGRENAGIRFFARQNRAAREFIVENLRQAYKEYGIYDKVKDAFGTESADFIAGKVNR